MILETISDSDYSIGTKPSFTLRCYSVENYRIHHPLELCCSDHCHRRLFESAERKKVTDGLPISWHVYASWAAYFCVCVRIRFCSSKRLAYMSLSLVLRGALAPGQNPHNCVCTCPSSFGCNAKCVDIARKYLYCKRSCGSPSFTAGSRAPLSVIFRSARLQVETNGTAVRVLEQRNPDDPKLLALRAQWRTSQTVFATWLNIPHIHAACRVSLPESARIF